MSFAPVTLQSSWRSWIIFLSGVIFVPAILLTLSDTSYSPLRILPITAISSSSMNTNLSQCLPSGPVDLSWYSPAQTMVNNLSTVLNGSGIYDFVFNSSSTPSDLPYSTYNWCNMPHVRAKEYQVPDKDYQLQYVELVRYSFPRRSFHELIHSPGSSSPQKNALRFQPFPR